MSVIIPQVPIEPDVSIENAIVSILSASCTIPVAGFHSTSDDGMECRLSSDTFVSVTVSKQSQDAEFTKANSPMTFSASVVVHVAQADDANRSLFIAECKRAYSALVYVMGDCCNRLNADCFDCDFFQHDSSIPSFEGGDNPVNTKAYSATLKGRITTATEA